MPWRWSQTLTRHGNEEIPFRSAASYHASEHTSKVVAQYEDPNNRSAGNSNAKYRPVVVHGQSTYWNLCNGRRKMAGRPLHFSTFPAWISGFSDNLYISRLGWTWALDRSRIVRASCSCPKVCKAFWSAHQNDHTEIPIIRTSLLQCEDRVSSFRIV